MRMKAPFSHVLAAVTLALSGIAQPQAASQDEFFETTQDLYLVCATEQGTKGKTAIVIAHRLVTVQRADKIIVLDKGNIVEMGTHKQLLRKKEGYYRNLYEVQFAKKPIVA